MFLKGEKFMDVNVNYHSSIRIGDIYVDPFNVKEANNDARYIFVTHSHYDHYSTQDIKKIINENTVFICTRDVKEDIEKVFSNEIVVVEPNKEYVKENISFSTFPSYNINKNFHPRNNNWVGYIINVNGVRYAILGDSDLTDEVKAIKCDVLFVPIGGTYTMDAKDAAELTNIIKPKLVIPVHYNGIVGNKDNEKEFLRILGGEINCKLYV